VSEFDNARSLGTRVRDEASFRSWYEKAMPKVYGYLFNRCGRNQSLAEELTQQTFVEAVRSKRLVERDDDVPWLIGVARNQLLHHLRGIERRERGFLRLVTPSPPRTAWVTDADPEGRLASALERLPAAQRAAVTLRYVDDLPVREVARLMGRSEASVESLLSRGRAAMRERLSEAHQ